MQLKTTRTAGGGTLHYIEPLDRKDVLLFFGRDNFNKSRQFMESLIAAMHRENYTVLWYEDMATATARLLEDEFERWLPRLEKAWRGRTGFMLRMARKLLKALLLLKHPAHWSYFVHDQDAIAARCRQLRRFIRRLGNDRNVFILAHSAGGRISSLIEDEPAIRKLVCFGYPFRRPGEARDEKRVRHLATLAKPCMIVQGSRDEYGGREIAQQYRLSPQISVSFVDADHGYENLSEADWGAIIASLRNFIESGARARQ